ncbi:MAG: S1 RNA-binding domain-containing protein [Candidatus Levyibacteriota bacterium]
MVDQKSNNLQKKTSKATSMADLMKSVKVAFVSPKKGENLEGTITKLTSYEILIDIGAKTEALVLEKDKRLLKNILNSFKVGDRVTVSVLNPESEFGNPVVSLRRFINDKIWVKLAELQQQKKIIEGIITEATKGGFIVLADNISGFLPNSQASFLEAGQSPVGKKIKLNVIELNRDQHKIIFSQKANQSINFEKEIVGIKPEQKITSTISNIAPFGVFVSLQGKINPIEGLIHISEISWEKLTEIPKEYKAGDKIEAVVVGFDKKAARVNLSVKRLKSDPFEKELEKYEQEKKITASVSKVISAGVLFDLGNGIEGIVKKDKIPPKTVYNEGQTVSLIVLEVDKRKHRVTLVPVLMEKPIGYR